MTEEWRPVADYEGLYEVSSLGRVRSFHRASPWIMAGRIDRYGYHTVLLSKGGVERCHKVHRLVCAAFNGPAPEGTEVGHLDSVKLHNVPANLAWVTAKENYRHNTERGVGGLKPRFTTEDRGERHPRAKLTESDVRELRSLVKAGVKRRAVAASFGISLAHVHGIMAGNSWSHVCETSASPNV